MKSEIIGCAFAPRCSLASERCTQESPALKDHGASDILEIPLSKIVH
jgi:ABC-type dipeptide/oligopeptide/nickel transport system ATPase component